MSNPTDPVPRSTGDSVHDKLNAVLRRRGLVIKDPHTKNSRVELLYRIAKIENDQTPSQYDNYDGLDAISTDSRSDD